MRNLPRLLQELDYYKYQKYDKDKIDEIEAKLDQIKKGYTSLIQPPTSTYVPYPELTDPDFYDKIYYKKEFNKTKALPVPLDQTFDEIVEANCSSSRFRLTNNQIFIKNFLSPSTPYNGLLLFHGVGVGKCFGRDTPILMHDGSVKLVQNVVLGDKVMGDDSFPRNVISITEPSMAPMFRVKQEFGISYSVNIDHILSLMTDKGNPIDMSITDFIGLDRSVQKKLFGYKTDVTFFSRFQYAMPAMDPYVYGTLNTLSICTSVLLNIPFIRNVFLAGTIDTFGKIVDDHVSIPWSNDIAFLARSLGIGVKYRFEKANTFALLFGKNLRYVPTRTLYITKECIQHCTKYYRIDVIPVPPQFYFGFGVDGNHRFLLGDFTVTHNSCSAISIAEQFQNIFEKKTLVLMPSSLKDNFRKQIFDMTKEDQCTGQKYRQLIPMDPLVSDEIVEKRINRVIADRYQFSGFQEFANHVSKIKEVFKNEAKYISRIKEQYSNRVIIIDEVHNVREGDGDKLVTPILMSVIQHAENVKLVLLSATPMFNEASEIVWLVNLLLANDKRKLLNPNQIFDKASNLTEKGAKLLGEACKGYVSFMQGENPFSFPLRLYPSINGDPAVQRIPPQLDIKGAPISPDKQLQKLELIESVVSPLQQEVMATINMEEDEETMTTTNTQIIQISNIVYPNKTFGATGFKTAFNVAPKTHQLSYKQGIPAFLAPDLIAEYAPKIAKIVEYIKKSKGIVFVYSYYLDSGIIPLAVALEHCGFAKYGEHSLLEGKKGIKPFLIGKNQATYSIISAKKELSPDPEKEMEMIKSDKNKEGEVVKVVLGSSVSAEGLDFKCIREIHMLDPWYHLNKVEQIVGRAIRNCSHVALPSSQRNVTVFHHVGTNSKTAKKPRLETIDERAYRIAENKQDSIDKVEHILKTNAIDCQLNQNILNIDTDLKIDIETSQGKKIKQYPLHSRKEPVQCSHKLAKHQLLDTSTFNKSFYVEEIEDLTKQIAALYDTTHYYTLSDLQSKLDADDDILMYTLDTMLNTKTVVMHANVPGYLIYRSNIYMFQPSGTSDTYMPLRTRENYKRRKEMRLTIDANMKQLKASKSPALSQPLSLVTHLENQISELEEIIKTKISKQLLYDYVIDRMEFGSILDLAKEVFTMPKSPIVTSLVAAHILVNKTWIRNIYATPLEYVQWNSETGKFQKVTLRELTSTKLPEISVPQISDLRGYVEKMDRSTKFKIVDTEKAKSNGYVCMATSTLKIDVLRKMITDSKPAAFTDLKKPLLCDVFELVLRSDPSTFARPYVAKLAIDATRANNKRAKA